MMPQSDSLAHTDKSVPELLERILDRLASTENSYFGLTVAAPVISPARVFSASLSEPAFLWATAAGSCEVGLGTAVRCESSGPKRVNDIVTEAEVAFGAYQGVGVGAASIEPRFFGGFSYAPSRFPTSPWREFRDAEFILPRLLYRANLNRAAATLFISRVEARDTQVRRQCLDALLNLTALGASAGLSSGHGALRVVNRVDNPTRDRWDHNVREACQRFDDNQLEKVVLAREIRLECSTEPDSVAVLDRLLGRAEGSIRYALRSGSATFLGATPERLVLRRGSTITTEALAGSASIRDSEPEQLLSDSKNLLEHSLVVREIVARLERLGADVSVPETPQLKRFGSLTHLHTLLQARKLASPHVLEIAEHLHPTPAVGGIPLERALEFIAAHESFDRGRYAGPVGWFDGNGDGEFAVALRSGLISGKDIRLYAGAGLVHGSEPDAEWRETDLKFQSFLDALGLNSSIR